MRRTRELVPAPALRERDRVIAVCGSGLADRRVWGEAVPAEAADVDAGSAFCAAGRDAWLEADAGYPLAGDLVDARIPGAGTAAGPRRHGPDTGRLASPRC